MISRNTPRAQRLRCALPSAWQRNPFRLCYRSRHAERNHTPRRHALSRYVCSSPRSPGPGPDRQSSGSAPGSIAAHPDWPKANPADVQSVDAILAALYDVISGPAGQPRDWNRFRSLFIPDARLIPVRHSKTGTGADVVPYTPEQYQERATPLLEKGFFERGIHNTTESFGDIVHVFSTYESRHTKDGAALPARHQLHPVAQGRQSLLGRHHPLGRESPPIRSREVPAVRAQP